MTEGKNREKKWDELEERIRQELAKARKRALLADSFDEMEEMVDEIGQVIQQEMLSTMAEQREGGRRPTCPECGGKMVRRGRQARQMKTSKGEVKFERDRWSCRECGTGLFPPGQEIEA